MIIALMAHQDISGEMIGEGDLTAPATENKATTAALDKAGSPPAVEKQDNLLIVGHRPSHRQGQGAAEKGGTRGAGLREAVNGAPLFLRLLYALVRIYGRGFGDVC